MAATTERTDGDGRRQILRRHPFFSELSESDLERLVSYAVVRTYPTGTPIFRKGTPGEAMMVVLSGSVRIASGSTSGREVVLNVIGAGQVFGEIALIDGRNRTADAIAGADCKLMILRRRDFLPFLDAHPALARRFLVVLCERLRRTTEQVEDVIFRDLDVRLAKILLTLVADADGPAVVPLSQQELGRRLGISRESINKQLNRWREDGLIDLSRGAVRLLDTRALELICEK